MGANIGINKYAFQRYTCPIGYEKDTTNYGTLCYRTCSDTYTRHGSYCHSGVSSHQRSVLPTKITTLKTEQKYDKNNYSQISWFVLETGAPNKIFENRHKQFKKTF